MTTGLPIPAETADLIRLLAPYADGRRIAARIGLHASTVCRHIVELNEAGATLGTPWIEPRMRRTKPGTFKRRAK